MNENKNNSLISVKQSKELSHRDASVSTESGPSPGPKLEDGQPSTWPTYESFSWFLSYTKMFTQRLIKDLLVTLIGQVYFGQIVPPHIADLISVQKNFVTERESKSILYRREDMQISVRNIYNAIKTYIISSEDDIGIQCTSRDFEMRDREPMFVIVDSSCLSDPSSREIIIENKTVRTPVKKIKKIVQPIDMPSTSTDITAINIIEPLLKDSESTDEMIMVEINLQSENEIPVENDIDNDSIVMSYLRNKTLALSLEGTILTTKKISSILEDVPKMETVLEGETFLNTSETEQDNEDKEDQNHTQKLSETSLDVHIPSFPGSPRSIIHGSIQSLASVVIEDPRPPKLKAAIDFLHEDNEFLGAAEFGDVDLLKDLISRGTKIQQKDQLGRNALHLAICSGNNKAISILLEAGVDPNVKDNVGMTPLSLCLWRSPTLEVVELLFDHGAVILPRSNSMDTGLFLQYVMICTPTSEEEKILRLLAEKGALINDPEAPGGRQALHLAAMSNNCELIEILIQLGANLYLSNSRNQTPKEFAQVYRCKEAYRMLEELEDLYSETLSYLSRKSTESTTEESDTN